MADSATDNENERPRRRGRVSALVRAGAGAVLLPVFVVLLALAAFVASESLSRAALNALLARVSAGGGVELRAGGLSGHWLSGIELRDVTATRGDTVLARIDTLRVAYNPLRLLGRAIDVRALTVAGGTVDLDRLLPAPAPARPASKERRGLWPWHPLRVETIALRNATIVGRSLPGARERPLVITDLDLRADHLALGSGWPQVRRAEIAARVTDDSAGADFHIAGTASLAGDRLRIAHLAVHSPRSALEAGGELALGRASTVAAAIDTAAFHLTAHPLDLADVAAFVPGLDLEGRLDLEARLEGARIDAWSGHLAATLAGFRHGGFVLAAARLDAAIERGRADVTLAATLDGAPLHVRGWIRPLDREPSYDLAGELARLPARAPAALHRLLAGGDCAARFQVTGRGFAPLRMEAESVIELAPAFPARSDWGRGTIRVGLRSGVLRAGGELSLAGAAIDAAGEADLASEEFSLSRAVFANVDLSAFAPGAPATALNGTLTAAGRGFSIGESGIDAALTLEPSRFGTHDLARASVRGRLHRGAILASGDLLVDGATITLDRGAFRLGARPGLDVDRLAFAHVNLARFTRRPRPATDLNGTVGATIELGTPLPADGARGWLRLAGRGQLEGKARLDLAPSTFDTIRASTGHAEIRLARGRLALAAALDTDAGRIALRGSAADLDREPSFTLDELTTGDLDLAPWSGRPALASRLDLALSARGRGLRRESLVLSGTLRLDPSRLAAVNLTGGQVDFDVAGGRARMNGRFTGPGGSASLDAQAEMGGARPEFKGEIDLSLSDLASLLARDGEPGPSGSGLLHALVQGRGRTVDDLVLDGRLSGSGRFKSARLDTLALALRIAGGRAIFDSLFVRSPVAEVRGSGRVPLTRAGGEADLALTARARDLSPLAEIAGLDTLGVKSALLAARLTGRRDALRFSGNAAVERLAVDHLRLASLRAKAAGRLDDSLQVAAATGELDLTGLRRDALAIRTLRAGGELAGDSARVHISTRLGDADSLHAAGIIAFGREKQRIALNTLDVHQPDARWSLRAPATIAVGDGSFRIDDLDLASDSGRLAARGGIDRRGEQDLDLRLDSFRLGLLFALRGRSDLDGEASGHLRLTGPAARPAIDAALAMSVRSAGGDVAALDAHLESEAGALLLHGAVTEPAARLITFEGRLPLRLCLAADSAQAGGRRLAGGLLAPGSGELELTVAGDRVPLRRFQPLLDPALVGELDGRLDVDVRIPGPPEAPAGKARLRVTDGRLGLPRWGVTYKKLTLDTELAANRLRLTTAEAHSGDGRVLLRGDLTFQKGALPAYDFTLTAEEFAATRSRNLVAVVSGRLALTGAGDSLRVTGTLEPNAVEVFLDPLVAQRSGGEIELTPEDRELLAETFGYGALKENASRSSALLDAAEIDLGIVLNRNVWVRHRVEPKLAVELTGALDVRKPRYGAPGFYGRIETIPRRGFVEQFGRQFDVREGELSIAGDPSTLTFDVRGEYRATPSNDPGQTEIVVTLDIGGTPEKLSLTLGSEPELSNSEIVSLIATGSTEGFSERGNDTGGATAAGTAAEVGLASVTGAMTAGVEELAERAIGLDVVQIRQDGLRGATLVAGKYVSPNLYVGFRQPVVFQEKTTQSTDSSDDFEVEAEYSVLNWLVLNLQGGGTVFRSYLRGRYAY